LIRAFDYGRFEGQAAKQTLVKYGNASVSGLIESLKTKKSYESLELTIQTLELIGDQAVFPTLEVAKRRFDIMKSHDIYKEDPKYWIQEAETLREQAEKLARSNPSDNAIDVYEKVIEAYDTALVINPKQKRIWETKGEILVRLGEYENALVSYKKALEVDPSNRDLWIKSARLLQYNLQHYEKAAEFYNRALEIRGVNDEWCNKGACLFKAGRYEEAIKSYDEAIKLLPDDIISWQQKAFSFIELKKYEEAIKTFDKALEISQYDGELCGMKVKLLLDLERYQEALDTLDKFLKINQQESWAWSAKGRTYELMNKPRDALKCYNKALEINPNDEYASRYKSKLLKKD
jgi:tetratricopeptide (TPR) repeat protein